MGIGGVHGGLLGSDGRLKGGSYGGQMGVCGELGVTEGDMGGVKVGSQMGHGGSVGGHGGGGAHPGLFVRFPYRPGQEGTLSSA